MLQIEALTRCPRFVGQDRALFDRFLQTAQQLAGQHFAPHYRKADLNEPQQRDGEIDVITEVKSALEHFAAAGFLSASHDTRSGGQQLPRVISQAGLAFFQAANITTTTYAWLTMTVANLLNDFASTEQKQRYMLPMLQGRYFATMAWTESESASSLDLSLNSITTTATPLTDGSYAIKGEKHWVLGGEHKLSENIIHLVLARIDDIYKEEPGLSLFIVPRYRLQADGPAGVDNNVCVSALHSQMGYHGVVNTNLQFGASGECRGYLIGEQNQGKRILLQGLNELWIGLASGAATLGYAGYQTALNYVRQVRQHPSENTESATQPLLQQTNIRRLLLAQKVWVEGGLALSLYTAQLLDHQHNTQSPDDKHNISLLLEILIPVGKVWCTKYALKANEYALQILADKGYTRNCLIEQYYRDNWFNLIYAGTNENLSLDLLDEKLVLCDSAAYSLLMAEIRSVIIESKGILDNGLRRELRHSADRVDSVVLKMLRARDTLGLDVYLANAALFMDMCGRLLFAWIWLKQAVCARRKLLSRELLSPADTAFYRGKLKACQYFFAYELPLIVSQSELLMRLDMTFVDMDDAWF